MKGSERSSAAVKNRNEMEPRGSRKGSKGGFKTRRHSRICTTGKSRDWVRGESADMAQGLTTLEKEAGSRGNTSAGRGSKKGKGCSTGEARTVDQLGRSRES